MDHLIWNIDPEIFRLGPFAPRWYGVFFASGFALGYWIMARIYRRERRPEENLSSLFLYIFFGTLIGARLGHVLFYQPDYFARPWEILMIWQGGLASHGGFAGVLIALYFYWREYSDMSFLELGGRLAIAVAPAAGLIRIGNFFNSEILGVPTNLPWSVVFLELIAFRGIRRCFTRRAPISSCSVLFILHTRRQALLGFPAASWARP